jgi:hypothetical protein
MGVVQGWYQRLAPRLREQIAYAYQRAPAVRRKMDAAGMGPAGPGANGGRPGADPYHPERRSWPNCSGKSPPSGASWPWRWGAAHIFVSPGPIYDPGGE